MNQLIGGMIRYLPYRIIITLPRQSASPTFKTQWEWGWKIQYRDKALIGHICSVWAINISHRSFPPLVVEIYTLYYYRWSVELINCWYFYTDLLSQYIMQSIFLSHDHISALSYYMYKYHLLLRGPAYVKTSSPTNHQNQLNNDVIIDCSLSKPYMESKLMTFYK